MTRVKRSQLSLPPESSIDWLPSIRTWLATSQHKIVVLDDDPTGTQTVYDTPVRTEWSVEALAEELAREGHLFYVLTNSRALPHPEAVTLAKTIGQNLAEASKRTGRAFTVISRGDSTLRGHFPAEVDSLAEALGVDAAVRTIVPYFLQGGRLTIDNVHYVADGDDLIPAAETPFARDATFGFQNSNLIDWVVERGGGSIAPDHVHSIGLDELRVGQIEQLVERLTSIPPKHLCVVNAVTMADVRTFVWAAMQAESAGQTWIHRTAASFVQAYAGLDAQSLLTSDSMVDASAKAGLMVVGSHVAKTRTQLARLLSHANDLAVVELDASRVLNQCSDEHVRSVTDEIDRHLNAGRHTLLKTSDDLVTGDNAEASLRISVKVSRAVVDVVRHLQAPLRFLVAKGGITSSDVATQGLDVRRANVLGQILPGVPVWKLDSTCRRPGLAYVVFPGNVGDDDALVTAYEILTGSPNPPSIAPNAHE